MPTYVYEVVHEDGSTGERFEVDQPMADAPLTEHPETDEPVRRVLLPPNISGRWSSSQMKNRLSDKNLGELGFTKYVKAGGGNYEKRAGQGPDVLSAD